MPLREGHPDHDREVLVVYGLGSEVGCDKWVTRDGRSFWLRHGRHVRLWWDDAGDALEQIHQVAEWETFRGTCDHCRPKWAKVCRVARDASADRQEL